MDDIEVDLQSFDGTNIAKKQRPLRPQPMGMETPWKPHMRPPSATAAPAHGIAPGVHEREPVAAASLDFVSMRAASEARIAINILSHVPEARTGRCASPERRLMQGKARSPQPVACEKHFLGSMKRRVTSPAALDMSFKSESIGSEIKLDPSFKLFDSKLRVMQPDSLSAGGGCLPQYADGQRPRTAAADRQCQTARGRQYNPPASDFTLSYVESGTPAVPQRPATARSAHRPADTPAMWGAAPAEDPRLFTRKAAGQFTPRDSMSSIIYYKSD
mmetsp:Transcript_22871/g.49992  ORF Transcript_22871/g.49992 Transcript_22871/m.49992 type:complete len:274 (-) Transcript_22871:76-897(-)